ncbi:MAG: peptidase M48 [Rhodobacteraceae bacterium]|nr:MAG: peptidase M48 [Paracoccaceae bacterium]
MNLSFRTLLMLPFLVACVETSQEPTQKPTPTKPTTTVTRSAQSGLAAFARVSRRIEPIAEKSCRAIHKSKGAKFCDFVIKVDHNPKAPANAFQSIGKDGRPVLTFNINMIRSIQNDHEIAFILGHETGHQIASHLVKTRNNQVAGAVVGGLLAAIVGVDVSVGTDLGGLVGARSYSKDFELQADRIGTHIASRAGYDPRIGARSFNRTKGSNGFLSTHPPTQERINTVAQTDAKIRAARANGQLLPIAW